MKSVATEAARARREVERVLSPTERLELSFRLWDDDLELFRAAQGLTPGHALAFLRARRQLGRRASRCMQEDPST